MSATSFQRKRRELREQTSVAARMNEEGPGDPYAKTDDNYDAVGVKDTGTEHQQGSPPPYSETPHAPERLDQEPAARHQAGEPPETSVEIRGGYRPGVEGDERPDQERYAALDKRDAPLAQASEENVDLAEPGFASEDLASKTKAELQELAAERDVEGRSSMTKAELIDALGG